MTTLAVDLGGTHMRCAAVSDDGAVTERSERDTPHDGTGVEALISLMQEVSRRRPCDRAVLGLPGRVDYEDERLDEATHLPAAWVPHLCAAELQPALGLPVSLANDADLAAVGEAFLGAGAGHADVAYITISTGIGAGVVLGGRLVRGRRSMAEVGHTVIDVCRDHATLEGLASGTALGDAAVAAGVGRRGRDVLDAAAGGNAIAKAIWDGVVEAAAAGIVNLAWTFTPEVIVVGGGLGLIGDVLLAPIRAALAADGPKGLSIAVVPAALGDDAGLAGAARWHQAAG